jgi:hypothetical protein
MALVVVLLACSACGSDESSDSGTGFVQFVNGIQDAPTLLVEIEEDGDLIESVSALAYAGASGLTSFARGAYEVDFYYEDPEDGFNQRLLAGELEVRRNTIYLGLLTGSFDNPLLTWIEKPEGTVTDADSEDIELQVINLSEESLSFYLGDDDDGLAAESLVTTIASGQTSTPVLRAYDDDADYRVRLTRDGSDEIIYESVSLSISQATRQILVATESVGPDPAAKSLFAVGDSGAIALANSVANSGIAVFNAVPDAADAKLLVETSASGEVLVDASLLYGGATELLVADASFIDVETRVPANAIVPTRTTVSLSSDTAYLIIAAGNALEDDVSVRANELALRSIANAVNAHLVNALSETDDEDVSAVDFYALPLGDSLSDTLPAATSVGFLEGRNAILPATPYDLVVTTAGTQSILAGPSRFFPEGGERQISVAAENAGGGLPNQILSTSND